MSDYTLYDITESIAALAELIDARPDDHSPEAEDEQHVDALLDEFLGKLLPEKVDGYCKMIESIKAAATAKRAEARRLVERARVHENTVSRMVDRLKDGMLAIDRQAIDTDLFRVTVQASPPSVVITDEQAIPAEFVVHTPKVNKSLLKAVLKAGNDVPGATLAEGNTHLRIK